MSDGPSKMAPTEAEPLDEIILGDDDSTQTDPPPPAAAGSVSGFPPPPKPSQPPPLRASVRPPERPSAPAPAPSAPPAKRASSSNRIKAAADTRDSQGRKRAKMTLRIPDDEISRPNLPAATSPQGGMPVTTPSRPPSSPDDPTPFALVRPLTGPPPPKVFASADDTLELPDTRARLEAALQDNDDDADGETLVMQRTAPVAPNPNPSAHPAAQPAAGIDPSQERGWTPFQPEVASAVVDREREAMVPIQPTPIVQLSGDSAQAIVRNGGGTILDTHEINNSEPSIAIAEAISGSEETEHHSQSPVSEDIPVEMDIEVPDPSSDDVATRPRLPTSLDSEEIRIEEGERISETGEVEVAPEDLVSVESLPVPGQAPPPVKTAGKYPAFKADGPTATALMQGVPPATSGSRPAMAAVTPPTPIVDPQMTPPQPAVAAPVHHTPAHQAPAAHQQQPAAHPPAAQHVPAAQHPPVAQPQPAVVHQPHQHVATQSQPAMAAQPHPQHAQAAPQNSPPGAIPAAPARQPSNPLIFVPPVGALAPPPMTDTAAHRKKTRPWWEELFNDDFIRTMAKVTDQQIGGEVNFIEESLGCEAGAMILDLACGTGRHAVELAARGYQVVGFDLSLAMLARASDEAQDRKQKINFVQGDMREMTFEETFDGVYSWNTSFGYFDEEKNGAVIARVHKALKKGGQFLLDVVNRDYIVRQAPSLAWFEGDGCICMDEMTIDFITSRMKVKRTLMMDDGRTKEIEYSVRVYALHELGKMLHDNGFRVAEVSGRTGTPGVFFGCESPRTLILAEKR